MAPKTRGFCLPSAILAITPRSVGADVTLHAMGGPRHGSGAEFDSPALVDLVEDFAIATYGDLMLHH